MLKGLNFFLYTKIILNELSTERQLDPPVRMVSLLSLIISLGPRSAAICFYCKSKLQINLRFGLIFSSGTRG